jgi:hypothetical protein
VLGALAGYHAVAGTPATAGLWRFGLPRGGAAKVQIELLAGCVVENEKIAALWLIS